MIEKFYKHFECSVVQSKASSEWFPVTFYVRHGCNPLVHPLLGRHRLGYAENNTK